MIPPEDEQQELIVHRMVSLATLLSPIVVLFTFFAYELMWRQIDSMEFEITVSTQGVVATEKLSSGFPTLVIANDGTVTLGTLISEPSDRDLKMLRVRLGELKAFNTPSEALRILPEPECHHQRLIEVLSAVQRSGIRWYRLE